MAWDQRMVEWAKGKLLAMLGVASLLIVSVVLCVIAIVVIPILWIKEKLI